MHGARDMLFGVRNCVTHAQNKVFYMFFGVVVFIVK